MPEWCATNLIPFGEDVAISDMPTCVASDGTNYLLEYCVRCTEGRTAAECGLLGTFADQCIAQCGDVRVSNWIYQASRRPQPSAASSTPLSPLLVPLIPTHVDVHRPSPSSTPSSSSAPISSSCGRVTTLRLPFTCPPLAVPSPSDHPLSAR